MNQPSDDQGWVWTEKGFIIWLVEGIVKTAWLLIVIFVGGFLANLLLTGYMVINLAWTMSVLASVWQSLERIAALIF